MTNNFAPHWYSEEAIATVKKGYLLPGETVFQMYRRLSETAAAYYQNKLGIEQANLCEAFYEIFVRGWFSPASPVAANFGAERGLPVSCYGIEVQNSVHGIFSAMHECAMLSKNGGGLGVDISGLLGPSNVVTWAKGFDYTALAVSQSGVRRGSVAAYLDIEHPDVEAFLHSKDLLRGDYRDKLDCNIAIKIGEAFMAKLRAGEEKAVQLFSEILELRMKFGSPYLQFTHNAQYADPAWYKDKGLATKHSQLCCLLGLEQVLTGDGFVPIKELCNKLVTIWDGFQWVKNQSFEFKGFAKELMLINFTNSEQLLCTLSHRHYLTDGRIVKSAELEQGMRLKSWLGHGDFTISSLQILTLDEPEPVYCTTVPTTGMFGLANGLMTGNSEIFLHSDAEHTYSCVLSSLNLDKWAEWRDVRIHNFSVPQLGIFFLDAVNEEFIQKGQHIPGLEKAVRGAIAGRPLAMGTLGYHNLLMQKGYAFDSTDAYLLNIAVHKFISSEAQSATRILAEILGECPWCEGHGRRNTHVLAVAPTTTNSILCNAGTPGIEPQISNYYVMAGAKGSFVRKNKYLAKLLESRLTEAEQIEQTWEQIRLDNGSVQKLNCLTDAEKMIFRTAYEIDQRHLIRQAADRQQFIDQGQSLNLFFDANADAEYIAETHLLAEELGLKALYYVRSTSEMNKAIAGNDKPIVVYSRPDCPYCIKAKQLLDKHGLVFIDIHKSQGRVPEIWIDGEKLDDGYTSLAKLLGHSAQSAEAGCTSCEG